MNSKLPSTNCRSFLQGRSALNDSGWTLLHGMHECLYSLCAVSSVYWKKKDWSPWEINQTLWNIYGLYIKWNELNIKLNGVHLCCEWSLTPSRLKLSSCECQKIWLIISQHWFRWLFGAIRQVLWCINQCIHMKQWGVICRPCPNFKPPLMVWYGWLVTVYPKKYAHGFCFAVLCCGYTLTDFPISIRLTSLTLWQSNDCPSASKATLMNMDKYFMWIHYERLHNHNIAKHNKTVCIFLGIYCTCLKTWDVITYPGPNSSWSHQPTGPLWHIDCQWTVIINSVCLATSLNWISDDFLSIVFSGTYYSEVWFEIW